MQMAPGKLSSATHALLIDPENELFLSAASSWEIAIKWRLGKLPLPKPPAEYVPQAMERQGVLGLPVQHRHALHLASLPNPHHDPFDRLLVAQAATEELRLLTADRKMAEYPGIELLWA
jgi:PIN domain nuclease of toxin-antitoxin system